MKKLMMIVPSMRGGGSERVMTIIANNLNRNNFSISLVLLKNEGEYIQDVKNDLQLIDLQSSQIRYSFFKLYNLIKTEKPDIVFSTLGAMNLILAILKPFFKNIKFIARESSILTENNKREKYPKIMAYLYKKFYNNFDYIVCQSNYMLNDMVANFRINSKKTILINNPVDIEKIQELSEETLSYNFKKDKINLIAVGRLNKVKGFDSLLEAVYKLEKRFHLTILGDGDEKESLINLVHELNIQDNVTFLGFQQNPYKYMSKADFMIVTSKYEGFPNVVLEANVCGIPVIAFNSPGGISEIINDDVNGILVEYMDIDALVLAISSIVKKNFNREDIKNSIRDRYSLRKILNKYEKLFNLKEI